MFTEESLGLCDDDSENNVRASDAENLSFGLIA